FRLRLLTVHARWRPPVGAMLWFFQLRRGGGVRGVRVSIEKSFLALVVIRGQRQTGSGRGYLRGLDSVVADSLGPGLRMRVSSLPFSHEYRGGGPGTAAVGGCAPTVEPRAICQIRTSAYWPAPAT